VENGRKEQKGIMIPLNEQQKELLFDYCLGLTTELENAQIQELIFSNEQASRLVSSIKASLSPLDTIAQDECPEELAEGTVWRAQQAMRTGWLRLGELLEAEQQRKSPAKVGLWRDIFGRLATAAVFIIVGSILIGGGKVGLNYAHQRYWQHQCAAQLGGLFNGLSNYKQDNDGQMPTVAATPGTPWWKVGYQGPENVSNTRKMWLLVRNGYAQPGDFVCPATDQTPSYDPREYNDFPSRTFVTYSFRIGCPQAGAAEAARRVVISDMNPLFKIIPERALVVKISDELLRRNSPNHNGRGQNVLFCDGSVRFIRVRHVDASLDDIFTLQNTQTYEGVELPESEADAFLAP
jgi:prepilin-type processing-associated H-X9-DG protein